MTNRSTKKFYFADNTCERRSLDAERLYEYFGKNSFESSEQAEDADLIFFFSCGMLEVDSNERIKEFVDLYGDSEKKIVVFGCYSKMVSKRENFDNIHYIPLNNPDAINEILSAEVSYSDVNYPSTVSLIQKDKVDFNSWDPRIDLALRTDVYSVRVSQGCSQGCSFCSIRLATGRLRSETKESIRENIEAGIAKGYKIFRIQTENFGEWGQDIGENLGTLLNELEKIEEDFYIDLPDLYPTAFINCFDDIVSFVQKKSVYYIHLPVQSANQRVLKLMNRIYDVDQMSEKLEFFQKCFPEIRIGADIIAGFPSETNEEFLESWRFLEKHKFEWVYLHGFNAKEKTKAMKLEPKIPEAIINKRVMYVYNRIPNVYCFLNNYRPVKS